MSRYTRWLRDGAINASKGSTAITGSGTYWETAGINPGDMLEVNNSGLFYEIATINSDTSITLARAYQGDTVSGAAYAIVRNFTATMLSKIAAQTAELIRDFKKYVDTDMDRLTGRSAYEIAQQKGYTGTEAQWLESLKGLSAYQLAVAGGYTGTVSEWLESLKGLSAYQIAKANGYTGTEAEWLDYLHDGAGLQALSARVDGLSDIHMVNTIRAGAILTPFTSRRCYTCKSNLQEARKDLMLTFPTSGASSYYYRLYRIRMSFGDYWGLITFVSDITLKYYQKESGYSLAVVDNPLNSSNVFVEDNCVYMQSPSNGTTIVNCYGRFEVEAFDIIQFGYTVTPPSSNPNNKEPVYTLNDELWREITPADIRYWNGI